MRTHLTHWLLLGSAVALSAMAAEPATKTHNQASATQKANATQKAKPHAGEKAKPHNTAAAHKAPAYKRATPVAAPAMQPTPVAPEAERVVVAEQVHTGRMTCELGNFVTVSADPHSVGGFVVQLKQHTYHMLPVVTSTGAVRLEDAQAGAMWLQLSHKSMLMNSKIGQRMADECQSPDQAAVAQAMKLAPPPSLLDGPAVAKK